MMTLRVNSISSECFFLEKENLFFCPRTKKLSGSDTDLALTVNVMRTSTIASSGEINRFYILSSLYGKEKFVPR